MKTKKLNGIISKFALIVLSLIFAFSLVACERSAFPVVKGVVLVPEEGRAIGEIGANNVLSYSATEGSEVEVTIKKGESVATAEDCVYTAKSKSVVFYKEGKYTLTVKATLNELSDEESVQITATAPAPVLANVSVQAKSGQVYGRTTQEHEVSYTVSKGSEVSVTAKKNGENALLDTDYSYDAENKVVTFLTEGEYEVVVTAAKNDKETKKFVPVSVYDIEAPLFTQAVSVAAKEGEVAGRTNSAHVVSYAVEAESERLVVKKNGEVAAQADYAYDSATKEIVFLTSGTWEVIVSATKSGKTSKSAVSIKVADYAEPVVSNITLTPSEYGYFRGKDIGLSYDIGVPNNQYPVTDCTSSVSVMKGTWDGLDYIYSSMTENEGYTYDATTKKLNFSETGNYKIVVSATAYGVTGTAFAILNVGDFAKPKFDFALGKSEATENEAVDITVSDTIVYDVGDAAKEGATVQYSVRYKAGENGTWAEADAAKYTLENGKFTGKVAGYYEVAAFIESKQGVIGKKAEILRVILERITLTPSSNYTGEWMRVALNTPLTLDYTVSDSAVAERGYTLTTNGDEGFTVNGASITAQFAAAGTYEFSIVYTSKSDETHKETIVYKLAAVADVANAPKFQSDPFDGTFDTLVPNVGLMLYAGATDKDGGAISSVNYELDGTPSGVSIKRIANGGGYPFYVVATDVATKTFKVKMTVKDAANNEAVAFKTFKLEEMGDGKTFANMADYGKNFTIGDLDYSNMHSDMYRKVCLTKTGFVTFPEKENSAALASGTGDFACVRPEYENFQLDFKMTLWGVNTVGNKNNTFSLSLGIRTVKQEGWAGNIAIKEHGDKNAFDSYSWLTGESGRNWIQKVSYSLGNSFLFRVKRQASGSDVVWSVWYSTDGSNYAELYNATCPVSTEQGKGGAPVYMVQFGYEAGCFGIENVRLTNLG